jgi:hypothetical protein
MDCIDLAYAYRKNFVTSEEVEVLHNSTIEEVQKSSNAAVGAVVFAMAGRKIEFALVNDYGIEGWNLRQDTGTLLKFMDPVGVVVIGDGEDESQGIFRTFKGHAWAQKYATQIINQAHHTLPMYDLEIVGEPLNLLKQDKTAEIPKHAPLVKSHNGKVIEFPRRKEPAA